MTKEKISGIYKIENIINAKIYIGSAVNINKRWIDHLSKLKNNKHPNKYLQNSFNKYGKDIFIFSIVEIIDKNIFDDNLKLKDELIQREQYWINKYDCCNIKNGYNILPIAYSTLGLKLSEETKDKIRKARQGENSINSKLTESDVIEIKKLINKGYKQRDIAKIFNVSYPTISDIKKGNTWKHLNIPVNENIIRLFTWNDGENNPRSKLTKKDILNIKLLISKKITDKEIADLYKVAKGTIEKIRLNDRWNKCKTYHLDELYCQTEDVNYNVNI